MRIYSILAGITGMVGIGFTLLFASVELETVNPDLRLGISGDAWVEYGQFVKFFNKNAELDHAWVNRTFMHFNLDADYKERLHFSFGMEGRMWFNIPKQRGTGQATYVHRPNNFIIISDANAKYSFGNVEKPWLSLTAGLFPYKYNPEVRNLGEYLFRSGTYPGYLINTFDLPFARLTGFKVSSDLFGSFHQDLIYSIETTIPPFYDGSVTYIANYNWMDFIDVGAGVQFANLVSVDERETTPEATTAGGVFLNNMFIDDEGDTSFYTFRGTKIMGKLCINPLKFVQNDFFGEEDLKLYTEAAILGVKNYPANDTNPRSQYKNPWGYDSLKQRVPVVLGINWFTHPLLSYTLAPGVAGYYINQQKFDGKSISAAGIGAVAGVGLWLLEKFLDKDVRLDILTGEFEYYGCPYPNSYRRRLGPGPSQSYPVPDATGNHQNMDYTADDWKFSFYAKKTFFDGHLGVILQMARDHIRNETVIDEAFDYEEALGKSDHWWWMMKILAKF